MSRQQLFAAFFFAVFLFLLAQLYSLFSLFLVPLVWTVILVLTVYPLYSLLLHLFQGHRTLASLLMTLLVVLFVAVPVFLLTSVLTNQVIDFYQWVQYAVQSGELQGFLTSWQDTFLGRLWRSWGPRIATADIDIPALALQGANAASQFIVGQATGIARNLFVFLFDFLIMSFSLFFVFRDGEELYKALRDLIPMHPEHKDEIFQRFYETVSAVVQGMIVTAIAQGVLAGIGFWTLGMPFSFVLACAAALFSLQPLGGSAVVWLPCALYLGFTGSWTKGVILLVYGTVFISGVDNIIRPLIIGGRTKLPTLFLFFGILGGLKAYGFLGIFLGPVVLATIMAFVNIYREEYAQQPVLEQQSALPPTGSSKYG
jgi:predicted PurR-regulated permease PerM